MSSSGGPCGPLGAVGTGQPPATTDGFCVTPQGPGQLDLFMYQGDTFIRTITWESPPGTPAADLTGAAIKMQVRAAPESVCPTVLFGIEVGTGIVITDGPNATFQITFSSAQTVLLVGSDPYIYDLQVTPAGAGQTTILRGGVFFDQQVSV